MSKISNNNLKLRFAFKKIKIGKITLRNRIISSPISINMANNNGMVNENVISFFTNLGKAGVGMVTIGAAAVSEQGNDTKNGMIIGPTKYDKKLKQLSKSIKKTGAKSSLQIYHVGSQGNPKHNNQEIVGPSRYKFSITNVVSKELSIKDIEIIENNFCSALVSGYKNNFDFLEIHLAHGYLLHEFLSNYFNKRKDSYGGNFKNRCKILYNILQKSYKICPELKGKIGFRLSANDYVKNGFNLSLTKKLINKLDYFKPAYYVITAGLYETAKYKYIDMKNGKYWEYAKKIKQFTKVPVVAQGGITNLYLGDKLLKKKCCDIIGMAQSLIADPNLIKKTISNKDENIVPCVAHLKIGSCHRCRYIKQKDLTFDCITPTSWRPPNQIVSKKSRNKDLLIWKILNQKVYKNKNKYK